MTFHEVKRTSKAGDTFVGECTVCGKQGVTLDAMQTEICPGAKPVRPLSPQMQAAVERAKADPRSSRNSWKGYRW